MPTWWTPSSDGSASAVLSVSSVDVFIQHSHILRQVSLAVGEREVVCLVGRNGAGKTTTLRTIMGYVRPRAGRVVFGDEEIHGRPTHEIARRGIGFAPEDSGIFADLTVAENIEIATWTRPGGRPTAERLERAYEVFPVLRKYRHRKGPEMSGGERKMLSVARALMSRPKLMLMDEPSLGLAPLVVEEIFRIITELHRDGTTIFLVEQNAHMALTVAQHFYLIEQGRITFSGDPGSLAEDEVIHRAYLGSAKV